MSTDQSSQQPLSQRRDQRQILTVVGIVIGGLLAIYSIVDLDRFLICLLCGFLVLGGYMIRCPPSPFARTAEVFRVGIITATILVPALVLTSSRVVEGMPQFLETVIEELSSNPRNAHYLDQSHAKVINLQGDSSRIVRWVESRRQIAVLETRTLGEYLSNLSDSKFQIVLWVIIIGIVIVLVGLFVGTRLAAVIDEKLSATKNSVAEPE